jgi:LPS-assembly lipoprotein
MTSDRRGTRRQACAPGATLVLAGVLAGVLGACGSGTFHLTTPQPLSYQRIALSGFADRSTMATEIKRAMPSSTAIVENINDAQVVVEALVDTRETTVEASTAFGQVRELELHCLLRYRVVRPDGTELLKPADFERFRDLTYDEKDALAKDTELNTLYRAMQADMAVQLVRVLAAVGKPTGPAAQVGAAKAASEALSASGIASGARAPAPAASATPTDAAPVPKGQWGAPAPRDESASDGMRGAASAPAAFPAAAPGPAR